MSEKKHPGDIDLCFDITTLDERKLKREFPQFFDLNEIGKIRREFHCHIFHYHEEEPILLDMLKEDREGNRKGLVKLDLQDIVHYDHK